MSSVGKIEITRECASDVNRFQPVKINANRKLEPVSAKGDQVYGIATESGVASDDDRVNVQILGVSDCAVDGSSTAIAEGDDLMPDGDGDLIKHDGTSGAAFTAVALSDASGDGDEIPVMLKGDRSRTS